MKETKELKPLNFDDPFDYEAIRELEELPESLEEIKGLDESLNYFNFETQAKENKLIIAL